MARTASTMTPLGTPAPDFRLPDTDGRMVSPSDFAAAPGLLVVFMCNHCPFVQHLRVELAAFAREYTGTGLAIVGINSNDATSYPDDSPAQMALERERVGYTFPYLFDESQQVARAYGAACTPDFFLFDGERRLVYRGQFDDSRPGNDVVVTGADVRAAAEAVLGGWPVSGAQSPASAATSNGEMDPGVDSSTAAGPVCSSRKERGGWPRACF